MYANLALMNHDMDFGRARVGFSRKSVNLNPSARFFSDIQGEIVNESIHSIELNHNVLESRSLYRQKTAFHTGKKVI